MQLKTTLLAAFFLLQIFQIQAEIKVTVSRFVLYNLDHAPLPYLTILVKTAKDSAFVMSTASAEDGRFKMTVLAPSINFNL